MEVRRGKEEKREGKGRGRGWRGREGKDKGKGRDGREGGEKIRERGKKPFGMEQEFRQQKWKPQHITKNAG